MIRHAPILLGLLLFLAFAKCGNAQYVIEVQQLPIADAVDISSLEEDDGWNVQTIKLETRVYTIENSDLAELVAFIEEHPSIGILKTHFSLSKFPEYKEKFKALSYDARKVEVKSGTISQGGSAQ